jgi:hypothetical protein
MHRWISNPKPQQASGHFNRPATSIGSSFLLETKILQICIKTYCSPENTGSNNAEDVVLPCIIQINVYATFNISLIRRTIISCLLKIDDLWTGVRVKQGLHPTEAGHTETSDCGTDSPLKIPSKSDRNSYM